MGIERVVYEVRLDNRTTIGLTDINLTVLPPAPPAPKYWDVDAQNRVLIRYGARVPLVDIAFVEKLPSGLHLLGHPGNTIGYADKIGDGVSQLKELKALVAAAAKGGRDG